jgi:hypothetical protein
VQHEPALLFDHVCALLEKSSLPCSLECAEWNAGFSSGRRLTVPSASQLMNSTSVPLWTILLSACASQLVRWTQP